MTDSESDMVETVRGFDVLGARVMEGRYPDGRTEVRIWPAYCIRPETAADAVRRDQLPVDVAVPPVDAGGV